LRRRCDRGPLGNAPSSRRQARVEGGPAETRPAGNTCRNDVALTLALEVLSRSCDDRALALAGRLWLVDKQDADAEANYFRAIKSEAIVLHPQVVIERDKALDERGRWLNAVSALDDEWLAERRANWLIDCGNLQAAFDSLRSTCFQLVHQRYERTRLWRQVEPVLV
jgi:hypothetical protein